MKTQTAVEWLIEQINQDYPEITWAYKEECERAKQMEKEQIMEAHYAPKYGCFSEEYYNETYN